MPAQTPSQTVGPFFNYGLFRGEENLLTNEQTKGQRIEIKGTVLDGDGEPLEDAMIEIWQADAQGIYGHPADPQHEKADKFFHGFGRAETNPEGHFWFKTIKPGRVVWDEDTDQAPHILVRVFGRGMLIHATTRLYFSDEESTATDPVLNSVDEKRRSTLIATLETSEDLPTYRFDIHLQGKSETVFFDP